MKNIFLSAEIKKAANRNLEDRDYWLNRLHGKIEKVGFPYDFEDDFAGAGDMPGGGTGAADMTFPLELARQLLDRCKGNDYALHIYLTMGLFILMYRYTGFEDIIVAAPIYKQQGKEGLLNRVVALRCAPTEDKTIKEQLLEVKQILTEAIEHQNYPIEMLPEQLDIAYSDDKNGFPLFDTAILLENIQDKEYLERLGCGMIFSFAAKDSKIAGAIHYDKRLYEQSTADAIGEYYIRLLNQAAANLDGRIGDLLEIPEKKGTVEYFQRKRERRQALFTPPQDSCQQRLAELWADILQRPQEQIGIDDDFFKRGGNSLKAGALAARIHQEFDVRLSLKAMFAAPTIRGLADLIHGAAKEKYAAIPTVEKKEYYSLSSAQLRLFILDQQGGASTAYNTTTAVRIRGILDTQALERAFSALIGRHESLRTSITWIKGEPVQRIYDSRFVDFNIRYYEGFKFQSESYKKSTNSPEDALLVKTEVFGGVGTFFQKGSDKLDVLNERNIINKFIQLFDLDRAPLMRAGLVRLNQEEYILLVDIHHIIADGASVELMIREFVHFYTGWNARPLRVQYKDFALWEKPYMAGNIFKRQEEFWLAELAGELPVLQMPLDFKRPARQTFVGKNMNFSIPTEIVRQLNDLAGQKNATLNTLFLATYFLLLYFYTRQTDIIVASVVGGRNHADLENIIGMFANSLPLRNRIDPEETFLDFLEQAKNRTLAAYENQDFPFERMIDLLKIPIDFSRNPVFDTMLAFHNEADAQTARSLQIPGLELAPYDIARQAVKFDFKLDVFIYGEEELSCSLEYNTHIYKEESIGDFIRHFLHLLDEVTAKPGAVIKDIALLTPEEEAELAEKRRLNAPAKKKSVRLAVSATYTAEPLEDYIKWWGEQFGMRIETVFAPYNQVFQQLLDENSILSTNTGANLLLIRFEDWLRDVNLPDEMKCAKLEKSFQDLKRIITNKKITAPWIVGLFPTAAHPGLSARLTGYIEDLNQRWRKLIAGNENLYPLDFTQTGRLYQVSEIFDPTMDKEGHAPFSHAAYAAQGTQVCRLINALINTPFKAIALDCDNTLWNGICGEAGAIGVRVEEPHLYLQRLLLQKYEEGMLLTLCSKNNEADVWEVFEKNPGMLLTKDHFAAWEINWQPKSGNIRRLAQDLNIGADSFIFIDDSPVECAEVMTDAPEVLTLCLPQKAESIPAYLEHVWAFDKIRVTQEDRRRTGMYQAERKRRQARDETLSLTDYLKSLELKVGFNIMKPDQLARVSQLTQRTNQFNLSTIRREESEIMALLCQPGTRCWVVEVSDRFGDYGLVGVVITVEKSDHLFIDTFLLSCRVLGRGAEDAILTALKKYCRAAGLQRIEADYIPTPKNKPIQEFLQRAWRQVSVQKTDTICGKPAVSHCANPSRNRPADGSSAADTRLAEPVQDSFPEVSSTANCRPLNEIEQIRQQDEPGKQGDPKEGRTTYFLPVDQIPETPEYGELFYQADIPLMHLHAEYSHAPDTAQEKVPPVSLDHIAVAVQDIDRAAAYYRSIGYDCGEIITDPLQNVRLAMCRLPGYDSLELVSTLDPHSPTANIVEQNGDIPYHLCYRTPDIAVMLAALERQEIHFEIVSEAKPAILFDRRKVIFIKVHDVSLVEFLETGQEDFDAASKKAVRSALQIVVPHQEPALKFYELLGYMAVRSSEDGQRRSITLAKTGAGNIELLIPGDHAEQEQRFLDRNGSHPYSLVLYGLPTKENEGKEEKEEKIVHPGYIQFLAPELQYNTVEGAQDTTAPAFPAAGNDWQVYGLDRENLLHKNYLLPLEYCTADRLLALPVFRAGAASLGNEAYRAPQTALENRLHTIWQGLLKLDKIGVDTSFFRAGGSSLKAILLVSKIEKELGAALSLREVFNHPTIRKLANYIEKSSTKTERVALQPQEKRDSYPLSSAQRRLYILYALNTQDITYNIPIVMQLIGKIEIPKMEATLKQIMRRHESLCTYFRLVSGEPRQCIQETAPAQFKIEQRRMSPGAVESFVRPFDLSRAPLFRVGLLEIEQDKHVFIVDMHHIVSDGTSLGILVNEFVALFNTGRTGILPDLPLRYTDFSLWQTGPIHKEMIAKQETYWLNRFKGKIPLLNLAGDFTRPETKSTKGAFVRFEIEAQTAEKLRDLARKKDATMFMTALTLFNILLFKLTTQEDIIIGTVTAGRRQRDLESIVGMFINTLPLRNFPQGKKSFMDFLEDVRETTLEAFDNEDYQFEDLVEKVLEKRDPTRNPLFDVLFAYGQLDLVDIRQEVSDYAAQPGKRGAGETEELGQDVLRVEPYRREGAVSKFDMIFSGTDDGEKLFFSINYCTAIFKEETAARWAKYFAEIAAAAAENEQVLLKDITISHDLVTATSDVYRDQESDFEF